MSLIRLREPVFWECIKSYIFCARKEFSRKSSSTATQIQFMMSSLNIELVHIILTAVSKKTVGTPKH